MVLGIIGKSGSGKSTAAKYLTDKYGYELVDLDLIGKEVVSLYPQILAEVEEAFGVEYILGQALNRPLLGKLVFANPDKLELLNQIFFKYIKEEISLRIKDKHKVVIEGAVLTELSILEQIDKIIYINTPVDQLLKRLQERESTPLETLTKRVEMQTKYDIWQEKADFVLENIQNASTLYAQLDLIMAEIK